MHTSSSSPRHLSAGALETHIDDTYFTLTMSTPLSPDCQHDLGDHITSFLRNKKLSTLEVIVSGASIARYSKSTLIAALQYVKTNTDKFNSKSYQIRSKTYDYDLPSDLLLSSYTFTPEELLFWDHVAQIVHTIPLQEAPKTSLLSKLKLSTLVKKKEVKNTLRYAPIGFAALGIILGQIKQMDDPEHLAQQKSRVSTDFGVYYSYTLEHKDIPEGLKVIHLSDIHLDINTPENMQHLARFAEEMDTADFVFLTGDIFHEERVDTMREESARILKRILSKATKGYFVLGNHDYRTQESASIVRMLDSIGYTNATNTYFSLTMNGQQIGIAGMDDYLFGTSHPEDIHIDTANNIFTILLTHNLDGYAPVQYRHQFVDLVLSGHSHSGEIELGFVNGTAKIEDYENTNHQLVGLKKLPGTETISYISPGFSTMNPLHVRLGANPAGPSSIVFKKISPTK